MIDYMQNEIAEYLRVAINRNGRTVNEPCVITAKEQDHASNIFGLRPFREIGIRHSAAVCSSVDDAGQHRVDSHACAFQVLSEAIHHRNSGSFGGGVGRGSGGM